MGPDENVINESEHYQWFTLSFMEDFSSKLAMNILAKIGSYFFIFYTQSFYFMKDLRIIKRPCAILMFTTPLNPSLYLASV